MIKFNRNEQIVLLVLCTTLVVGLIISNIDKEDPDSIPDFEVRKIAVPVPPIQNVETPTPTEIHIETNNATAKELERLPGIGPQVAGRIVAHREKHGAFQSTDDIKKVSGIAPKTLDRLRPHLKLSSP